VNCCPNPGFTGTGFYGVKEVMMYIDGANIARDSLKGKVAVVTGAGQGIGRETARILARLGAAVVIAEIRDTGADVAKRISSEGGTAIFVKTDVSAPKQMDKLKRKAYENYGKVDILVNNAAYYVLKPVLDHPLDEWDRVTAVNLRGAFLGIKAFLQDMLKRQYGVIVTFQSTEGMPYLASYLATKVGLRSLAASLALEIGKDKGVSVFCFGPGMVDSEGGGAAFRQLAPMYGQGMEDFISAGGGLISPELSATGLVGAILHAGDFHGEDAPYSSGLARIGLNATGEPIVEKPEPGKAAEKLPASGAPAPGLPLELNRELEKILEASMKEYDRLPMFARPVARRMFQQGTGYKVDEWLALAREMTRKLQSGTQQPAEVQQYITRLNRLDSFMAKQETDAHSWFKKPEDLKMALDGLAARRQTIAQLMQRLG
jgi:NAD(P)-dependent dehydrogenase (short-subunit alcohol dehydrogenase family)